MIRVRLSCWRALLVRESWKNSPADNSALSSVCAGRGQLLQSEFDGMNRRGPCLQENTRPDTVRADHAESAQRRFLTRPRSAENKLYLPFVRQSFSVSPYPRRLDNCHRSQSHK